jgi:hypothetical protein
LASKLKIDLRGILLGLGLWYLTPLSTIFQLNRGGQFIGGEMLST